MRDTPTQAATAAEQTPRTHAARPPRGGRGTSPRTFGRLAIVAALILSSQSAQAQSRGPLVILGLRAPDGDDEPAANATTALRRAARAAGFEVPSDSPALEQSMAAFGCDDSVPAECLAQIAADLHAERMVYGAVHRHGRGPTAQLQLQVAVYETRQHAITTHAESEVARAIAADNESLSSTARHLMDQLEPAPATPTPSQPAVGNGNTATTSSLEPRANHGSAQPSGATPVRRYAGIGLIAAGGVGLVIGVVFAGLWASLNSASQAPGSDWNNYHPNYMGAGGSMGNDQAQICAFAANDRSAAGMSAASTCSQGSLYSSAGWGLGIAGIVLLAGGAILFVTDDTGHSSEHAAARTHRNTVHVQLTPVVAPGYSGGLLQARF